MTESMILRGISGTFHADDLECLVRTAAEAVCGTTDDLSSRQRTLAARAYALLQAENDDPEPEPSISPEQRLLALASELGVDPLDLDDAVHDLHSTPASQINNGGLPAQISYLLDQLGEAEVADLLRNARGN